MEPAILGCWVVVDPRHCRFNPQQLKAPQKGDEFPP